MDQALEQAAELRHRIRRMLVRRAWLGARVMEMLTPAGSSRYVVVVGARSNGGWVQGVFEYRNSARRVAIHINRIVKWESLRTPRLEVLPGGAEQPAAGPAPRLVLLPGGAIAGGKEVGHGDDR